jgi:hypothetical protein
MDARCSMLRANARDAMLGGTEMKAKLSLFVGLAALAGAALSATQVAQAYPTSCLIRTYYSDAEMTEVVGMRTNCPGGNSWGRVTRHVETDRVELNPSGPSGPGAGKMPCEFYTTPLRNPSPGQTPQDAPAELRCQNLPLPR